MKRCVRCLSPDTRPGVVFDGDVCPACRRYDARLNIDYDARLNQLADLCDKYRRRDGKYDCIIPVSGGKDSHFQVHMMKHMMHMNPLLVSVTDSFEHTKAGEYNARNISDVFNCDMITLTLSHSFVRRMTRLSFEKLGSSNWAIDKAIYAWPLQVALEKGIPLVVYGENVPWEYGGVSDVETWDARDQISNDVVKADGEALISEVSEEEWNMLRYPPPGQVQEIQPIYLSYFTPWNDYTNVTVAKQHGFRTLQGEWQRVGYIDDYAQIDSVGYLFNYYLKYVKLGIGRVSDIGCRLVRYGAMTKEALARRIREEEHLLDQRIFFDFQRVTGMSCETIWSLVEKHVNKDLFTGSGSYWRLREKYLPQL